MGRFNLQTRLRELLREYAIKVLGAGDKDPVQQSAIRDAVTDLRHIADEENLNWDTIMDGADEVYEEEEQAEGR